MRTTRPLHDTSKKRRRTHRLRVLNRQDPATAGQRARRLPRVLSASCAIRIRAHICTCIKADTGRGSSGQHPILEFSLAVSSHLHVHRRRDVERLKLHSYRLRIERERRRGGGGGERAKDRRAKESKGRGPCGYEPAQFLFASISDFKVRSLSSHQLGTYDGSSHFYAEFTFASSS